MDHQYYFDYYKAERKHWFFRARNNIIMGHIRSMMGTDQKLKILNVGVATGHTSELLAEFGDVKSLEFDEACFEFTKENVPGLDLIQGSILELPFEDNSYDLVCAFDVVEHIEDDALGISELKRVTKQSGTTVITVPAFMSLWSHHDEINHHFKRYKSKEIKSLLSGEGKINYLSYFNFFLFPPVWLFRKLNNLFGFSKRRAKEDEAVGSDLDYFSGDSLVSKLLYRIMILEKPIILRQLSLPFGVSIIASWIKKDG